MPAKRARPKKLRVPEWYVSSFMMDRALDAVVRQIVKLDRRHDIPYLAGYSRNGKTIYIDRHMPKWFTFRGRRINTDRFLILHEAVEKALIDHLGLGYVQNLELVADRSNWRFQRAIADGGDWGGPAWTDAFPGDMAGTGPNASLAGARPGSTNTRVPTRTRR